MSSETKRNRNVLSIEKKIEIINKLEAGESGSSLAKRYKVGKATISQIKHKKDIILKFASNLDSKNASKKRKTMKTPKDTKLEDAVYFWYMQRKVKGKTVSGPRLCRKALDLNTKLGGPSDFKASSGWLKNFRSRHGVGDTEIQKCLSGCPSAAKKFKDAFLDILKRDGYSLDDIYNADETCLHYKSLPHKYIKAQRSKFEFCKERITIMLATNASGSHLLAPLVIGGAKNPRCFKEIKCLPVCYGAQKNALMNCEIFLDWYTNEFIPNVKDFREKENKTGKVLLLLDDVSHSEADTLNAIDENFEVLFIPPNATVILQPMDQGIADKLKMMYKKQFLHRLLLADEEAKVTLILNNFNIKNCCYMVADAWDLFSSDDIKSAWSKLLDEGNHTKDLYTEADLKEIVDMFQEIPGFADCNSDDAQNWLENDADPGFHLLNDEDILNFVRERRESITDEEEDESGGEDQEKCGPSNEDAITALETVMAWYEQQEESCPSQLLMMKRLRDLAARKCLGS